MTEPAHALVRGHFVRECADHALAAGTEKDRLAERMEERQRIDQQ